MTNTIQIFNNISKTGLSILEGYEISDNMSNPDAILLRSEKLHDFEFAKNTIAVGRAGAGTNNIPTDALSEKGVVVFNTPGANANAVKELVLSAMLLSARNLLPAYDFVKELDGTKEEVSKKTEAGKKQFAGFELQGKTLGVIGLGAIGVMVANAAASLGMKVIGYDPCITIQNAWKLSSDVEKATDASQIYANSDFITFHVPLIEATKGLFSFDEVKQVKKNAVILNFSRGEIVDDKAIEKATKENEIGLYISDFPSKDFQDNPKVFAFPHLGASTQEAEENCATMVCDQVKDFLENGNITNSVNFPEVYMPRVEGNRLAIINKNIPNMLATISGELGSAGINIVDMINKSRGEYAYTLVDSGMDIPESIIEHLNAVEGIIRARLI